MTIHYSQKFLKKFKKAPSEIKEATKKRLELFLENPYHSQLKNHELQGALTGIRSINITADWRAWYIPETRNDATFINLGTHSQLYS